MTPPRFQPACTRSSFCYCLTEFRARTFSLLHPGALLCFLNCCFHSALPLRELPPACHHLPPGLASAFMIFKVMWLHYSYILWFKLSVHCMSLSPQLPVNLTQVALVVKNPPANAGDSRDIGWIPGWGRSPGGGNGNPLQDSCLEIPWT